MKKLNPAALFASKLLEISHWLTVALMAGCFLCSIAAQNLLTELFSFFDFSEYGGNLSVYGFELMIVDTSGTMNMTAVTLFSLGGIVILSLMAMIFRNVWLIIRLSTGKARHTDRVTPFQKDTVRLIKELGIFYISIPIVGLFFSILSRLIIGPDAEISVGVSGFITGILFLWLTQVFAYGTQLQSDVDGLV
ncbi:MAG: hypothetical protein HFI63_02620 [Lachnospiraceae bacterium]|nr:hypothetical protein [Lachnospiraceae bacterium]